MSRTEAIARLAHKLAALDVHDGRAAHIKAKSEIDELESAIERARRRVDEIVKRRAEINSGGANPDAAAQAYLTSGTTTVRGELESLEAERQELQLAIRGLTVRLNDANRDFRYPGGPLRGALQSVGTDFADAIQPEVDRVCGELARLYATMVAAGHALNNGRLEHSANAMRRALVQLNREQLAPFEVELPSDLKEALAAGNEALELCRLHPRASYEIRWQSGD